MPDMRDPKDSGCTPTYTNLWVGDTICGCKIFETVLSNVKQAVEQRPTDTERADIIRSGNVFVYKERDNGIKRWTDGLHWSPSRISGNFLMYRELPGPFPPGHKKKALKRKSAEENEVDDMFPVRSLARSSSSLSLANGDSSAPQTPLTARRTSRQDGPAADKRTAERSLYGSLTKSYDFKQGGLMKKTMSVQIDGQPYHLVAYYNPDDVKLGSLKDSSANELLADVRPRADLLYKQSWRAPLELANTIPLHIGTPQQALHTLPHLETLGQLGYQPQYGLAQPASFPVQFGYQTQAGYPPHGQQFRSMNYPQTPVTPEGYYTSTPFPNYAYGLPQSTVDSIQASPTSPTYHQFGSAYAFTGHASQPKTSGYARDFQSIPPPPPPSDSPDRIFTATPSYSQKQELPPQLPRRTDSIMYQYPVAWPPPDNQQPQAHAYLVQQDSMAPVPRGRLNRLSNDEDMHYQLDHAAWAGQ